MLVLNVIIINALAALASVVYFNDKVPICLGVILKTFHAKSYIGVR